MQVTQDFQYHPSEDALEQYAFRRLSQDEAARLEDHLLFCDSCLESLEETEAFILHMKAAMAQPVRRVATESLCVRSGIRNAISSLVAVAAVFAIFVIAWKPAANSDPVAIALASYRGPEAAITHSVAGRTLTLSIEAVDLPASAAYRIEIVDATGKPAWTGPSTSNAGRLTAVAPVRLDAGAYWVRLYDGSEILREFGLKLE